MPYAICKFTHLDTTYQTGDEVSADADIVKRRPDLFTNTKPTRKKAAATKRGDS